MTVGSVIHTDGGLNGNEYEKAIKGRLDDRLDIRGVQLAHGKLEG